MGVEVDEAGRKNPAAAFDDAGCGRYALARRRRHARDPVAYDQHIGGPRRSSGAVDERDLAEQGGSTGLAAGGRRQACEPTAGERARDQLPPRNLVVQEAPPQTRP